MNLNKNSAINLLLTFIRQNVDANASLSMKTKQPVIHYAVPNGKTHAVIKGLEIPHVDFKKMDSVEALRICADMGWTNDDIRTQQAGEPINRKWER